MERLKTGRLAKSESSLHQASTRSTAAMARTTARRRPARSPKWGNIVLALNGDPLLRNGGVAWVGSSSLAPSLGPSAGVGGPAGPVELEVPRYRVAS